MAFVEAITNASVGFVLVGAVVLVATVAEAALRKGWR